MLTGIGHFDSIVFTIQYQNIKITFVTTDVQEIFYYIDYERKGESCRELCILYSKGCLNFCLYLQKILGIMIYVCMQECVLFFIGVLAIINNVFQLCQRKLNFNFILLRVYYYDVSHTEGKFVDIKLLKQDLTLRLCRKHQMPQSYIDGTSFYNTVFTYTIFGYLENNFRKLFQKLCLFKIIYKRRNVLIQTFFSHYFRKSIIISISYFILFLIQMKIKTNIYTFNVVIFVISVIIIVPQKQ